MVIPQSFSRGHAEKHGVKRSMKHGVRSCNQTNPQLIFTHGKTLANRIFRRAVPRHLARRSLKEIAQEFDTHYPTVSRIVKKKRQQKYECKT